LTSRVPVNYYYRHAREEWDCHQFQLLEAVTFQQVCWLSAAVSSAIFQLFVFFSGFSSLNFAGRPIQ